MPFAPVNSDLSYLKKQAKPLYPDLLWNIPEQKTGHITIIGGNSQGFNAVIRLAEYLSSHYPIRTVDILLPESLRGKLPPLPNLNYAPATESGSFAKSGVLDRACAASDFTILAGDFSRNSATEIALGSALGPAIDSATPLLVTRDSLDLLCASADTLLKHPRLFVVASLAQLQKLFRAVYYPKMLMLSQPLLPVIETLHKFTLSYPLTLLTFHENHILVAHQGNVVSTPISSTDYSPISLWSGPLAAKVAALNLFNPSSPLESTATALFPS